MFTRAFALLMLAFRLLRAGRMDLPYVSLLLVCHLRHHYPDQIAAHDGPEQHAVPLLPHFPIDFSSQQCATGHYRDQRASH